MKIAYREKVYVVNASDNVNGQSRWDCLPAWLPGYKSGVFTYGDDKKNGMDFRWKRAYRKGVKIIEATPAERRNVAAWIRNKRNEEQRLIAAFNAKKAKTAAEQYHDFYFGSRQGV